MLMITDTNKVIVALQTIILRLHLKIFTANKGLLTDYNPKIEIQHYKQYE